MSIISSNHRLVKVNGTEYSAGSGIVIEDYTISVDPNLSAVIDGKLDISSFSSYSATIDDELQYVSANAGNTYSAGDNIDIYEQDNDLYISAKDWTTDIANASSYAFNEATAQIPPVFDPTYMSGQIDNKLNKSDFDTYSGSVNTQISGLSGEFQTTSSLLDNKITAVRNDLNTVTTNTGYLHTDIQTTSGILSAAIDYVSANVGDEFPASANEAITAYQTYSGTYLTAHQDISNKLDTTAFSTVSGTFLTAHQDLSNYATTGDLNNASGILSGAIDYVSAHAGDIALPITGTDSLHTSAFYGAAGITYTVDDREGEPDIRYLSITPGEIYLNATFDEENYFGFILADDHLTLTSQNDPNCIGDVYAESISSWNDTYYTVQSNSASWASHQDLSYISGQVDNKLDTTAFSTVSGSFLTAVDLTPYYTTADANTLSSMLSGAIDYVSANAGDEFPASANEAITAYQNASGTYLTAHQPISANEWNSVYDTVETNSGSWGGGTSLTGDAQGAVDEVYSNSADWNSNYSTVNANSSTWNNGGFTGEVYGISGVSPNVDVYIDQNTLWISAAAGGAGNPEVESYVQTNSASIDDVVSTYETNSGNYLTAHQDISNKLDTTAFSTVSGTFLTAHQPISANEWNSVYDTVEANSGSWTGGGGGSIDTIPVAVISPLVTGFSGESAYLGIESTALNLSSYVPVSAIGVNSNNCVSSISGLNISATYSRNALTATYANDAGRAYQDRNNHEITSYYQPKLTIAGDAGTITAINGSAVGATIPEGWELVGSAGISIYDDSENNQTIISVTGGGDLSNYYTKTETSSKIELDNAIGNIETLLASL